MTQPENIPGVPAITWRGEKWPVPELAPRQLDQVWEPIIALTTALFDGGDLDRIAQKALTLTSAQAKDMRTVIYVGLTRAHKDLTEDEFLDTPISGPEMLLAFLTVRQQSLIYGRVSKIERPDTGEGKAGDQISNTSSPAPAATSEAAEIIGGTA